MPIGQALIEKFKTRQWVESRTDTSDTILSSPWHYPSTKLASGANPKNYLQHLHFWSSWALSIYLA